MKIDMSNIKAKVKKAADKTEEKMQKGVEWCGEAFVKVYDFCESHPMLSITTAIFGITGLAVLAGKNSEFQDSSNPYEFGSDEGDGDSVMELLTNLSDNINLKHGEGVFIEGNETGGNTICHYEKNLVLPEGNDEE